MNNTKATTAGIVTVLMLMALLIGVVRIAETYDISFGDGTGAGNIKFSLVVVIVCAVLATTLLAVLAGSAYSAYTRGAWVPLYLPLVLALFCISAILDLTAVNAIYRLRSNLRRGWPTISQQEVRTFSNLMFVGVCVAFGWITIQLLQGRLIVTSKLVMICIAYTVAVTVLVLMITGV